jgi:hypothetical protein
MFREVEILFKNTALRKTYLYHAGANSQLSNIFLAWGVKKSYLETFGKIPLKVMRP